MIEKSRPIDIIATQRDINSVIEDERKKELRKLRRELEEYKDLAYLFVPLTFILLVGFCIASQYIP